MRKVYLGEQNNEQFVSLLSVASSVVFCIALWNLRKEMIVLADEICILQDNLLNFISDVISFSETFNVSSKIKHSVSKICFLDKKFWMN